MAKRARGSNRPGQRRPIRRTTRPGVTPAAPTANAAPPTANAAPPSTALPASGLTAAEEARAAELESRLLEEERAAEAGRSRDRARAAAAAETVTVPRTRGRAAEGLAAQYAHEYDYVSRDLRRIATLMISLTGVMVVLWILIDVLGVFKA